MPSSAIGQAVSEGALSLAESLIALGWDTENVIAHVLSRYGFLQGADAEQIVTFAGEALAAGERLENAPGGTLIDNSGAPCIPGLSGADWQVDYKFEWSDPNTGQLRSWYGTIAVPPGSTVQDLNDGADDLFANTVGEEYFGGDLGGATFTEFSILGVTCPA